MPKINTLFPVQIDGTSLCLTMEKAREVFSSKEGLKTLCGEALDPIPGGYEVRKIDDREIAEISGK